MAKLRWRIERDYQELKQELGLGHFEGRSWRGFHHHATLCVAAYAFLLAQRIAAPKKTLPHPIFGQVPALPEGFRPRGSPARQRHVPDSITTLRLELAAALIAALDRCPCCGRNVEKLLTQ